MSLREAPADAGVREESGEAEGGEHWWSDRLVILRPEASDRDWALVHVVPPDQEELANRALATMLAELRI